MTGSGRLDAELVRRGLARSRGHARELVQAGAVLIEGSPAAKASATVRPGTAVELAGEPERWVGRAAYKLLEALRLFGPHGLDVSGTRCLDVGASTGGFTQVLLERGAAHVTALDVGHDQLADALARDPRVEERSGTNFRDITAGDLGAPFDVVVADVSFISLRLVLPHLAAQLSQQGDAVVLVKPQFEVGRDRLPRSGVVASRAERARVLSDVIASAERAGLHPVGACPSPIPGGSGNREYLLWVSARAADALDETAVAATVRQLEDIDEKGAP